MRGALSGGLDAEAARPEIHWPDARGGMDSRMIWRGREGHCRWGGRSESRAGAARSGVGLGAYPLLDETPFSQVLSGCACSVAPAVKSSADRPALGIRAANDPTSPPNALVLAVAILAVRTRLSGPTGRRRPTRLGRCKTACAPATGSLTPSLPLCARPLCAADAPSSRVK